MRLLYLVFFLSLLAIPVSAQTLAIRSGEHEDFSRLVITLPTDVKWSLAQQDRKAALTLDMPQVRFEIADVFKRIPRTRLAGLSQSGAGTPLEMVLACDCAVKGFVLSDRRLVIDIMDSKASPIQPSQIQGLQDEGAYRFPFGETSERIFGKTPFMLNSRYQDITRRPETSLIDGWPQPEIFSGKRSPATTNTERRFDLKTSDKRLLDQIDRAVDQGLLELTELSRAAQKLEDSEIIPESTSETISKPGLSAQTAIDRDLAEVRNEVQIAGYGTNCLAAEKLKLSTWGTDKPFSVQIGAWRSQLFQEFDAVNPDAQIGLTKNYIYFGFGAEARQILELTKDREENSDILMGISRILDGLDMDTANPFLSQHSCNGESALWAVLAESNLPAETNDDAVLQALAELPAHLRHLIGLRISRIYKNAGNVEIADTALRIAARAGGPHDPAVDLATAEISALKGDQRTASEQTAEVVASGSEQAAEALVKLVRMTWETRGELRPETAELADAYAMEYRGSTLGDRLQETHVLALALQGQFRDGFEALAHYEQRIGRPANPSVLEALFVLMIERADDVTFLELALENTPPTAAGYFEDITEKIARRLMDLGFFEEAQKLLGEEYGDIVHDDGILMRAETALAADLPHRAMAILAERTGRDADRLRAHALLKSKNHAKAAALFLQANEDASAARSFWLAGELDNVPVEATLYNETAQIVRTLNATNKVELPQTPLAHARALLKDSVYARDEVSNLLKAMLVKDDVSAGDAN